MHLGRYQVYSRVLSSYLVAPPTTFGNEDVHKYVTLERFNHMQ